VNFALTCLELGKADELANAREKLVELHSTRVQDLDAEIEARKQEQAIKAGKK
jgi:hypothetical protein